MNAPTPATHLRVIPADLAEPSHGEAVLALVDSLARDGGAPLADQVRRDLLPGLRSQPNLLLWLAEWEREFVGCAVCFLGFSTFLAKPLVNVHDLIVAPGQRGRGIGTALLEAVESEARRRGCCRITLEVNLNNERAQKLYRRHGFGPSRREDSQWFWSKQLGG